MGGGGMGAMVEWDLVVRKVFLIDLFRLTNQSEGSGGVRGRGVSATRVCTYRPRRQSCPIVGESQSAARIYVNTPL